MHIVYGRTLMVELVLRAAWLGQGSQTAWYTKHAEALVYRTCSSLCALRAWALSLFPGSRVHVPLLWPQASTSPTPTHRIAATQSIVMAFPRFCQSRRFCRSPSSVAFCKKHSSIENLHLGPSFRPRPFHQMYGKANT